MQAAAAAAVAAGSEREERKRRAWQETKSLKDFLVPLCQTVGEIYKGHFHSSLANSMYVIPN